jgi:hypothetical protein
MPIVLTVIGSVGGLAAAILFWPAGWFWWVLSAPFAASATVALFGFAQAALRGGWREVGPITGATLPPDRADPVG